MSADPNNPPTVPDPNAPPPPTGQTPTVPDPNAPSPPIGQTRIDPPEPLTESEAKEFIKKEVDSVLWERTKWIATVIGIPSVVVLVGALAGIYFSAQSTVTNTAKDTATAEAKQYAELTLAPLSKTMNEAFTQSLKDFVKAYGDLEKTKNSLDQKVGASQESIKKIEDSIQELNKAVTTDSASLPAILAATDQANAYIKTLQANLDQIKNLDTTKLATVLSELSKGDPTLLPKLDKIVSELQQTYTYDIKVVDSDPFALVRRPEKTGTSTLEDFEKQQPAIDSAKIAVGGIGRDIIGYEFKLPAGSEIVATWGVPYNGLVARKYAFDVAKSDPTNVDVTFSAKEKDVGEVRVYFLYKMPVHHN